MSVLSNKQNALGEVPRLVTHLGVKNLHIPRFSRQLADLSDLRCGSLDW